MNSTGEGSKKGGYLPKSLGIASILIGLISLAVGWIPHYGLLIIPVALIGGALAILGILSSIFQDFRGILAPAIGIFVCGFGILLPIGSTFVDSRIAGRGMEKEFDEAMRVIEDIRIQTQLTQQYIDEYLRIHDISYITADSATEVTVPKLSYSITNDGDRTLNLLLVSIAISDTQETELKRFIINQLHPDNNFSGSNFLKPGESKSFEFKLEDQGVEPAVNWSEENFNVTITSASFMD